MSETPDAQATQRSLGQRIRDLRNRQGLSQEEFAGLCGLHRTYIGHVERGEKNVSLTTVLTVANALGVRVSDLFREMQGAIKPGRAQVHLSPKKSRKGLIFQPPHVRQLVDELQAQRKALPV